MAFKPTKAQQQAIDNRGAMLVSAAAGSGKTAVLVERIMGCILDPKDPVDINRLLVVTFTNASAGEMRERIAARLQEEREKDPDNIRLMRQQMLLPKANICTIDAFCKTLVTQHFEQADLPPDLALITGNDLKLLEKEALSETMDFFFATRNREFTRLAELLGSTKNALPLEKGLYELYSYLRTIPFPRQWGEDVVAMYQDFTHITQSPWGKTLMAKGRRLLTRHLNTLNHVLTRLPQDEQIASVRGPILYETKARWEQLLDALKGNQWDEAVALARQPLAISYAGTRVTKNTSQLNQRTKDLASDSKQLELELKRLFCFTGEECARQAAALAPYVRLLFDCVWELEARTMEKKRERGVLDFADIEYAAFGLLTHLENGRALPTPYAHTIQDSFDYVLVDEFQDVNDLQSALFHALSKEGKNLFAVGDIKQSIYRFRKANPANFARMLDAYPLYDGVCDPGKVILDGNFRSRGAVCHTVNHLFSLIMTKEAGDVEYDQSHMLIPSREFPGEDRPVVMDLLEKDHRSTVELEADRIAMHIKEALATPCVTVGDTLRCATYKDCVILLRSPGTKATQYVERLAQHGIPAVAGKSQSLFESKEIPWLVSLLRAIDNPTDDLAMLTVMLSPFFEFTADELAALRAPDKWIPLYTCLRNQADTNPKVRSFLDTLDDLRTYGASVTPARLLQRIYDRFGYFAAVQVMGQGDVRRQNLLTMMELAEQCSGNGYDRLDGFVRYLTKLEQETDDTPGSAPLPAGDYVRIMSIHASKGLQFPLCFVGYCGGKFNTRDLALPVLLDQTMGIGLKRHDAQTHTVTNTAMRLGVEQTTLQADLGEELRVLYVAMTRAIDRLYLLTTFTNPQKQWDTAAGRLEGNLDPAGRPSAQLVSSADRYGTLLLYAGVLQGDCPHFTVERPASEEIPLPEGITQEKPPRHPADPALMAQLERQMGYAPVTHRLAHAFSKRSVSQLVHGNLTAPPRQTRPGFLQEGGLTAAEKGTALHEFMQYASYPNAAADSRREMGRLIEAGFLTQVQGEAVNAQKVDNFFASHLYQRIAAAKEVLREYHFMSTLPVTLLDPTLPKELEKEQVVVQGIADLLFREEDGWVIVDYKTDRVSTGEELAARYGDQLRLYAKMVKDANRLEVKELVLYSFHLDCTVEVPLELG